MGKSSAYKLVIVLILVLMIQACSTETPTPSPTPKPKKISDERRDEYFALIGPLLDEWEALIPLMSDRGSGWLNRIAELQEIRNEFANLEIDPYFYELHAQMILHMDCQIAAYVALVNPGEYSAGILLEEPEMIFKRCSFPTVE